MLRRNIEVVIHGGEVALRVLGGYLWGAGLGDIVRDEVEKCWVYYKPFLTYAFKTIEIYYFDENSSYFLKSNKHAPL